MLTDHCLILFIFVLLFSASRCSGWAPPVTRPPVKGHLAAAEHFLRPVAGRAAAGDVLGLDGPGGAGRNMWKNTVGRKVAKPKNMKKKQTHAKTNI